MSSVESIADSDSTSVLRELSPTRTNVITYAARRRHTPILLVLVGVCTRIGLFLEQQSECHRAGGRATDLVLFRMTMISSSSFHGFTNGSNTVCSTMYRLLFVRKR